MIRGGRYYPDEVAGPALSIGELGRALGEDAEPNTLLANVGRFLGRPGFFVRSLLRGRPDDALENMAQFALDLPTFGWADRRLSLANLVDETGDVTTRKERPEFTDVVGKIGGSKLGNLAADVIGGALTDPLTYLTLGAGGIPKVALTGVTAGERAATLATALAARPAGRAALAQGMDDALRSFMQTGSRGGRLGAALRTAGVGSADDLAKLAPASVPGGARSLGALQRKLTERATESILAKHMTLPAGIMGPVGYGDGIRGLEGARLIERAGMARLGIPFTGRRWEIPGSENVWAKIYALTAPAMAQRVGHKLAPAATRFVEANFQRGWEWAKGNLYDKALRGLVPEAARTIFRKSAAEEAVAQQDAATTVNKLFGDDVFTRPEREILAREWKNAHDAYQASTPNPHWGTLDPLDRDEVKKLTEQALQRMSAAIPGKEAQIRASMGAYKDAMVRLNRELANYGQLPRMGHEFYVPFQAGADVVEFLANGVHDQAFRGAVASVFEKRRAYKTNEEFTAHLAEVAKKHGVPLPQDVGELAENDLAVLMYRRLEAGATTLARAKAMNEATTKLGMTAGDPVHSYLLDMFKGLEPRQGLLSKLLGGGTVEVGGRSIKTRGLNYYTKAGLTVPWPAFHMRNLVSAALMVHLDKHMSEAAGPLGSFKQAFKTVGALPLVLREIGKNDNTMLGRFLTALREAPVIRSLPGMPRGEVATFLKAINGDQAAATALKDVMVGKWSGEEVLRQLRGAVTQKYGGPADLYEALGRLDALGRGERRTGLLGNFDELVESARAVGDHVENSFRIQNYMGLLRKGLDPTEAADRVRKAFVDYQINSSAERTIRDMIPFARFSLGITPVVGQALAQRPGSVAPLLTGQRSVEGEGAEGYAAFLPAHVRDSLALPLGGDRFLTSLGLPHEAAANVAEILPTPGRGFEGARRNVLGAMQPQLRTLAEATTGHKFYFDDRFGAFRRAPNYLPDALTQEITLPGGEKRREIPGWVNELISGTPLSRLSSTANTWFDRNKSLTDKVVNTATGVRITTVDQRKEVQRVIVKYLEDAARRGDVGSVDAFFQRKPDDELPEGVKAALDGLQWVRRQKRAERTRRELSGETPLR